MRHLQCSLLISGSSKSENKEAKDRARRPSPAHPLSDFATRRIGSIDGIVCDICIEVDRILIPNRVGLHEPAQRGRVDPGLVIVHAQFRQPRLAGVLEPADIGGGGDAIFVIGVDRLAIAAAVGLGDDRAPNSSDSLPTPRNSPLPPCHLALPRTPLARAESFLPGGEGFELWRLSTDAKKTPRSLAGSSCLRRLEPDRLRWQAHALYADDVNQALIR